VANAEAPLSYSSIRAYLECPLRWKFLYVDGLKEAPKGYFSFGRTVHEVLEALVTPLVETGGGGGPGAPAAQRTLDAWRGEEAPARLMSLEALRDTYRRSWISEGYGSREEEERYRRLGEEILVAFRQRLEEAPPHPIAVEQHLEATWDGIRVHGYVDRIDRVDGGGLDVLDYKTSRELSAEDARESDQLALYQVLVEKNYSEPVESLTLYHLRQLRPLSVPPKQGEELEAVYDRVGSARDGIRSRSFEPAPGRHCLRCEFQSRCPEFRSIPEGERARLSALADRFTALKEQEVALEGELRATAQELHAAAEALGVHRIPASGGQLHRRAEAWWELPPDWFEPLLLAHGLAGAFDPSDPTAPGRLLKDHRVPAELRAQVGGAGGRRLRWYWAIEEQDRSR
jgi:putative RecB family exonuclease